MWDDGLSQADLKFSCQGADIKDQANRKKIRHPCRSYIPSKLKVPGLLNPP
ncbi:hypothetical protein D1BOALGB6SA_8265 [Olavius sp. associated proteobacterium Delta 1]|nr:hypothetical protein D1BOALGB6SA_8265 [Olavius sp. associated proteobacterium Delta 1]